MEKNKYSAIAHQHHDFYNPISSEKLDKVISLLSLQESDEVIEIGSGKGEFLLRVMEKYNAHCVAIELFEGYTNQLKTNAADRGLLKNVEIIQEDAKVAIETLDQQYKVGVCIGSSYALGGYRQTVESLHKVVKKSGFILLGELYWKKKPHEDYVTFLGADEQDILYHSENIFTAEQYGLIPLWSTVANEDDWDAYEWLYSKSIEDYCHNNRDDLDCPEMLKRIRKWREMYLKWGRDTLGFGLYLYRNG